MPDLDLMRRLVAVDVEYRNPQHAVEPGIRRGVDDVLEVIARLHEMFEFTTFHPVRSEWVGERLVVEIHVAGRSRGSGVPVDQTFGHLWSRAAPTEITALEWFAQLRRRTRPRRTRPAGPA